MTGRLQDLSLEGQQYQAKLAELRAAIEEGDSSGIVEGDVFARVRKSLNLPSAQA